MSAVEVRESDVFFAVLAAGGRAPEIPESADAYGWLIGRLEGEFRAKRTKGVVRGHSTPGS